MVFNMGFNMGFNMDLNMDLNMGFNIVLIWDFPISNCQFHATTGFEVMIWLNARNLT